MAEGVLRPDLDIPLLADILVGPIVLRKILNELADSPDDVPDRLVDSLLDGLAQSLATTRLPQRPPANTGRLRSTMSLVAVSEIRK